MKAVARPLSETLAISVQYYIPIFQRHYDWKIGNWSKLWGHLTEYLPDRVKQRPTAKHFLGSIVGFADKDDSNRWIVIDGQQRLTSLFLLLIAIRDLAKGCEAQNLWAPDTATGEVVPLSVQINNGYLRTVKGEPKLKPRTSPNREKDDCLVFDGLLRGVQDRRDKDSALRKAYEFFKHKLLHMEGSGTRLQKLATLTSRIMDHLNLVEITLDADDDPHVVFDTLNSAGLKITEGDCLRNYFYMKLALTRHEDLRRWWEPIETDLRKLGAGGKDYLTSFCHDYLMMLAREYFGKDYVYLRAQGHLESAGEQQVIDFAEEMYRASRLYIRVIRHGDLISQEPDLTIREALRGLLFLEVEGYLPYVLYLYLEYTNATITKAQFLATLNILENYTLRNGIVGNRSTGSTRNLKLFPQFCCQLPLEELTAKLLYNSRYPTDSEIRDRLNSGTPNLYDNRSRKYNILIRQRLEQGPEQPDFSGSTLEHILPQDENNLAWGRALGENYPRLYNTYLHTLGNQVLLGDARNKEAAAKAFEAKREIYQKSIFKWTRRVGEFTKWGEEEIQTFCAELTEALLKVWPDLDPLNKMRGKIAKPSDPKIDIMQLIEDIEDVESE